MMLPVYSNDVVVDMSNYDVHFFFKLVTRDEGATPVVAVVMSPQVAKILALILAKQLAAYEARYGPLHDPLETPPEPEEVKEA